MDSQHFQTDKTISNHYKSMALWLVLSYLPCAFGSSHGYTDLCHIAGFIPLLLLTEILILLKIFLSVVAPSSFQRVLFRATPLWRSSHPFAMRLPLFLVGLLKPSLLPVASRAPSTGFTPGFPLRRLCTAARQSSQYMLRVILSDSGMNYFIAASLSEKSAWKLSQREVPGSDRLGVEASHHWAE